jgi:DNA-binding NtrC family response regulator
MSTTSVLIVDDEPSIRELFREFLQNEGYEVHVSGDGEEALGIFEELRPELVVTDLNLPGTSGISVISGIRKLNRKTPIIVMTGNGSEDTATDAIRLDVFDFISKPIGLKEFRATLGRAREYVESLARSKERKNDLDA